MYNYDNELAPKGCANLNWACYYSRLKNLACTMFKWNNLPDSVDVRYLEDCLFRYGCAVIFKNTANNKLMGLQAEMEGVNFYENPVTIRPISPVQNFNKIDFDDCVLVRNTPDMFPTIMHTLKYTEELYDLDQTRDINIKAQKTPIIMLCNDISQKQSMQALYQKYNGNTPVIYALKDGFDLNDVTVLQTNAPFIAGQLQDIKNTIYNEYLSILGIGITEFKRERSIVAESQQYQAQANALANIGLTERQHACDKINKIFADILDDEVSVELAAEVTIDGTKYGSSNSTQTNLSYSFNRDASEV